MSPATVSLALPLPLVSCSAARRPRPPNRVTTERKPKQNSFNKEKKELLWNCVEGCGACCKLQKGPSFPSPEEIFTEPSDVELYKSLVGPDGWCIHYEKSSRTCSIYSDRPYFCRVDPEVFESLYGIKEKNFNKEACSSCRDTIKAIYGSNSKELYSFDKSISSSSS